VTQGPDSFEKKLFVKTEEAEIENGNWAGRL
jgi:hypothetical protein